MPELPVIDPATIENLRALSPDDNGEFLKEISEMFLSDTPQRIAELEQSMATGDGTRFTRAAHSIKGSSANLGATALQEAAARLEHDSRQAPLPTLQPLVDSLKGEFERAKTELRKLTA
ncbi:MAG TPA: Hpt domain-containing protein [Opitutaceae bacterium]|jgi:HPt (histidine-containing phosphotransfer) domain-containing protein|nr:Hpt domain-containing protein [Opitutaceae bacterium]